MESATVPILGHPAPVTVEPDLYAYLLSINPLHNVSRWLCAHFIYWGSLVVVLATIALRG